MANQISPQGYQLNDQPINENPFWGGESPAPGSLIVTEIDVTKQTDGNYTTYTWSYLDQLGERHALTTQRVAGNAGDDGVTFTPHVSSAGVISWTNDGGLPNPDPVSIVGPQGATGPQGPQGIQGIQGPRGLTGATGAQGVPGPTGATGPQGPQGVPGTTPLVDATASVTNTTGIPAVAVTNTGEPDAPVFNFAFSGIKGETGATGPQGPQGVPGDVGATPEITAQATVNNTIGTPSVNVVQTGTAAEPVLTFNFSNLKGETGATGATGPAGQDGMGTIAIGTTTTGEPGTNASVVNSGTAENAILDFTIPRGATGATGPQGETGATGPQGPQGETGPQGPQGETGATGATGPQGPAGADGADGVGVPAGGTAGQVLKKASGTDYDTEWGEASGVPAGGSSNQVLAKRSATDGDTKWMSITQNKFPTGGTSGQILEKNSSTNYDASWVTKYFVPSGGTSGQVLAKNSSTAGDASWLTKYFVPTGGTAGQVLAKSSGTDGAVGWVTPSGGSPSILSLTVNKSKVTYSGTTWTVDLSDQSSLDMSKALAVNLNDLSFARATYNSITVANYDYDMNTPESSYGYVWIPVTDTAVPSGFTYQGQLLLNNTSAAGNFLYSNGYLSGKFLWNKTTKKFTVQMYCGALKGLTLSKATGGTVSYSTNQTGTYKMASFVPSSNLTIRFLVLA